MIFLIPAAILAIVGYFIKYRRLTWLISGYNTASAEKKAKYDLDILCRYMGNYIFILALLFFLMAVLNIIYQEQAKVILTVVGSIIAVVAIGGVIFLSVNDKIKKR